MTRALLCFGWCLAFCGLPLTAAEHRDVGLTQKGVRIEAVVIPGSDGLFTCGAADRRPGRRRRKH